MNYSIHNKSWKYVERYIYYLQGKYFLLNIYYCTYAICYIKFKESCILLKHLLSTLIKYAIQIDPGTLKNWNNNNYFPITLYAHAIICTTNIQQQTTKVNFLTSVSFLDLKNLICSSSVRDLTYFSNSLLASSLI